MIPCLLVREGGLVKSKEFSNHRYLGDPINAIKIFNDSEVDELIVLDIAAGEGGPNLDWIASITSECFMPICYGGGLRSMAQAEAVFALGVEKVCLNSALLDHPDLVTELSRRFGAQAVVVALDVRRNWLGKPKCYVRAGTKDLGRTPREAAIWAEGLGAGEILLQSIDRDGKCEGYDLNLIKEVSQSVQVPVIALGGAGKLSDFPEVIRSGASACAAGSQFVYHGPLQAVLINYPKQAELKKLFSEVGS